ncbi:MAG: hypothetical protein CMN30_32010 [Sandaracinus sp.]|nr:hypothetical protein [Sandaracinus sp.]MAQ19411.1 hypothetical protein [Sandaracinus sp.]
MLTADLVRAYRRQGELRIRAWKGEARPNAERIARRYVTIAAAHVGKTRGELKEALDDVPVPSRERKVGDGLRKLILDRCEVGVDAEHDPAALRKAVFEAAAQARREAPHLGAFDRDAVLTGVAASHGLAPDELERLLYADLKQNHRIEGFDAIEGEALVDLYDESQVQAVLLRAEKVVVQVACKTAATYRYLFRKLKFLRLLHRIEPLPDDGGYRIEIDGPFSVISSSTKYGLQLALAFPAIRACDAWSLEAEVRWGKARDRLRFQAVGGRKEGEREAALPDDVQKLLEKHAERFDKGSTSWSVAPANKILSLPGVGVCVPDLVFTKDGAEVYLEALGYWSRDAVWKRVELVEAGLPVPMVFAVPSRLRVSEEVLPEDLPAALVVYKGVIPVGKLEAALESATS